MANLLRNDYWNGCPALVVNRTDDSLLRGPPSSVMSTQAGAIVRELVQRKLQRFGLTLRAKLQISAMSVRRWPEGASLSYAQSLATSNAGTIVAPVSLPFSIVWPVLILGVVCSCANPVPQTRGLKQIEQSAPAVNNDRALRPVNSPVSNPEPNVTRILDPERGSWFGHAIAECGDLDGDGASECAIASRSSSRPGLSKVEIVSTSDGRVLESFVLGSGVPCRILNVRLPGSDDGSGMLAAVASGVIPEASSRTALSFAAMYDVRARQIRWERELPGQLSGWGLGLAFVWPTAPNLRAGRSLAIGAPLHDHADGALGVVGLIDVDSGLLRDIGALGFGGAAGSAIALVTDSDGDGAADLLVGFPEWQARGSDPDTDFPVGRVVLNSSRDLSVIQEISGNNPAGAFGAALVALDDWDGDGVDDFAVGGNLASYEFSFQGAVYVHSGRSRIEILRLKGDCESCMFGSSLLKIGDIDGDSKADLVVGAPGCGAGGVFSGSVSIVGSASQRVIWRMLGAEEGILLGESNAAMAWINVGEGEKALALGDCGSRELSLGRRGGLLLVSARLLMRDFSTHVVDRRATGEGVHEVMLER